MTNPIWQPGPPKVAGWFWMEWRKPSYGQQFIQIRDLNGMIWCPEINLSTITRHAGPVEIPQPVEPGEGVRKEGE